MPAAMRAARSRSRALPPATGTQPLPMQHLPQLHPAVFRPELVVARGGGKQGGGRGRRLRGSNAARTDSVIRDAGVTW
jgi:hypothetical protein